MTKNNTRLTDATSVMSQLVWSLVLAPVFSRIMTVKTHVRERPVKSHRDILQQSPE